MHPPPLPHRPKVWHTDGVLSFRARAAIREYNMAPCIMCIGADGYWLRKPPARSVIWNKTLGTLYPRKEESKRTLCLKSTAPKKFYPPTTQHHTDNAKGPPSARSQMSDERAPSAAAAAAARAQCNQMCHYYHCYCNLGPVGAGSGLGARTPTEMKIALAHGAISLGHARKNFTFVRGDHHFVCEIRLAENRRFAQKAFCLQIST